MSTTTSPDRRRSNTLARLTGLAYLAMIPGGICLQMVRARLLAGSAEATLANLSARPDLARLGVASAMTVIVAQALAALGFFWLYRERRPVVAFGIAGFGLINAAAILAGTAASWTALELVSSSSAQPASGELVRALLIFDESAWKVGALFFGLWLIPMGVGAATSGYFHAGRLLGGLLVVGGVGYVLGTFLGLSPALVAAGVPTGLGMLATLGELWTLLALLIVGVRRDEAVAEAVPASA